MMSDLAVFSIIVELHIVVFVYHIMYLNYQDYYNIMYIKRDRTTQDSSASINLGIH